MDALIVIPLLVAYFLIKYYATDHETPLDKDRKRFQEGLDLYEKGEYDAALTYFNEQIKEHPKSALAYTYRGKSNHKLGNLYTASYDFKEALSFEINQPEVHLEKGIIHYELEEYEEALLALEKAVWFTHNKNPDAIKWRNMAQQQVTQQSTKKII